MKTFGRSLLLPSWHSAKIVGSGVRNRDDEYLLSPDDSREQDSPQGHRSDSFPLQHEDYLRKTAELESYCESLEERMSDIQQSHLEEKARRYTQDQEIINTMKNMRDYIETLEGNNKTLTETLAKHDHDADKQSGVSDMTGDGNSTTPRSEKSSSRARKGGADWNIVMNMALKLSQAHKENTSLRKAMEDKREAIEELIGSSTRMRGQLYDAQHENKRLMVKCRSLQVAASSHSKDGGDDGKSSAEHHQTSSLQARIAELEEKNELLQTELQHLKAILSSTTAPARREAGGVRELIDTTNDRIRSARVRNTKVLPNQVKHTEESGEEDSDINSDGEDKASEGGVSNEVQPIKGMNGESRTGATAKGFKSASVSSGEEMAGSRQALPNNVDKYQTWREKHLRRLKQDGKVSVPRKGTWF